MLIDSIWKLRQRHDSVRSKHADGGVNNRVPNRLVYITRDLRCFIKSDKGGEELGPRSEIFLTLPDTVLSLRLESTIDDDITRRSRRSQLNIRESASCLL